MTIETKYNIGNKVMTEKYENGRIVGIHIEVLADGSITFSYDVCDVIGIIRTFWEHNIRLSPTKEELLKSL